MKASFASSRRGGLARLGDDLADPFVIKDARRARVVHEYADAATNNQRLWMIYGNAISTHQFHDVGPEWRPPLKRANGG